MLGTVMLSPKKDEAHLKMVSDALLEIWPGLKNNISKETSNVIPSAVFLLSTKHVKDNVERKLSAVSEKNSKEFMVDILGHV